MEKTITGIETQKLNPNRLNVFLDNEFAFGVSRYVGAWLATGKKLTEEDVDQLTILDAREKAFQKALHFINYKPRTQHEVSEKLVELGFSASIIDDVISELNEKNYLNDRTYAEEWVDVRSRIKPRSQKMIAYELRMKNINTSIISEALKTAPPDEELAHRLGLKYLRRYKHLDDSTFEKKMRGIFARRAFSFSVIQQEIKELQKIRNT